MWQIGAALRREAALDTGAVDLAMQMLKMVDGGDPCPETVKSPLPLEISHARQRYLERGKCDVIQGYGDVLRPVAIHLADIS